MFQIKQSHARVVRPEVLKTVGKDGVDSLKIKNGTYVTMTTADVFGEIYEL